MGEYCMHFINLINSIILCFQLKYLNFIKTSVYSLEEFPLKRIYTLNVFYLFMRRRISLFFSLEERLH